MSKYQSLLTSLILFGALAMPARAAIKSQMIDYKDGDVVLQGYLAYDDSKASAPSPGVLVVHEWWGQSDYSRKRADQLAELGYVAFALDMYGKGVQADTPRKPASWPPPSTRTARSCAPGPPRG